ncbi:hypothetical protein GPM19_13535 [Halomonas sp. ZH2S]|uniref:Minor curlin subunit n=1 Tax=Vreelandella zhuhanensis TaxID=2684210 RepID=A0A7X3KSP9_9GAMM|nr:hypothetical protein [Halomonas zhuhanensis]MWJ29202.1 hypothetical protein [Halomonas zhuhanensis]
MNAIHVPRSLFMVRKRVSFIVVSAAFLAFATSVSANDNDQDLIQKSRIIQHIEQTKNQVNSDGYKANVSIIKQMGSENNASVTQSQSASFQAGNFALIHQDGNQNNGTISQQGGDNTASIWQEGNRHNAAISQQGNSFSLSADIQQFGIASDINVSQSGSGQRSISIEHQAYSGNALPVTVETH